MCFVLLLNLKGTDFTTGQIIVLSRGLSKWRFSQHPMAVNGPKIEQRSLNDPFLEAVGVLVAGNSGLVI